MELFQELTFTTCLAVILSFLVAKIVSLAVSNSSNDGNDAAYEGAVRKEVTLSRGLRVRNTKIKKRVKFADDDLVKRVYHYESENVSEDLVLFDDVESVGEVIVEEKIDDEKIKERVDQFGENVLSGDSEVKISQEQSFDLRDMHDTDAQDKGCENIEFLIEEKPESEEKEEILGTSELKNEVGLESDDMIIDQKEGNEVLGSEENEGLIRGDVKEEEEKVRDESVDDDDDDDDWEGIERSELERVFAEAVNYLEYGGKGKEKDNDRFDKLSSDVQMQLYGLHKVAVEGPCHEPQPMALKVSARAKWNAWQRLGSMSQDVAMEQYIRILSDSIPGWMHDYFA